MQSTVLPINRRRGSARTNHTRPRPVRLLLEWCFLGTVIAIYYLYLESTVELPSEQDGQESYVPIPVLDTRKNNPTALLWIVIYSTEARLGNNMFQFAGTFGLARQYKPNPTKLCVHPDFDLPFLTEAVVGPLAPPCPAHIVNDTQHHPLSIVGEPAYATYARENLFPPCDDPEYCVFALKAYLQSYRYFDAHAAEIRTRFQFQPHIQKEASELLEAISTSPILIGIHVRRGDMTRENFYLREPSFSYYTNAMGYFHQMYNSIQFVVASDDPEWCEDHFPKGTVILRNHTGPVDMAILASCQHVILSRGSFGWWAAWLTGSKAVYYKDAFVMDHPENKDKVTLEDHFPPNWIGLGD